MDEPIPPSMGQYTQEHTKTWAAKIDSFDGYLFVTAEYGGEAGNAGEEMTTINPPRPQIEKNSLDLVFVSVVPYTGSLKS